MPWPSVSICLAFLVCSVAFAAVIQLGTPGVDIVQWHSGLVRVLLHSLFNWVEFILLSLLRVASTAMAFWRFCL